MPDRVKGALLCCACGLDASRRRLACSPGPPRRSTAARWPSCGSRSGAVGLLSAARIVAYGWIDSLYAGPTHRFTYLGFGWVPQPDRGRRCAALVVVLGAGLARPAARLADPARARRRCS